MTAINTSVSGDPSSIPVNARGEQDDAPVASGSITSDDFENENFPDLTPDDFESDEWIGKIYDDPHRLPLSVKEICFHALDARGRPTGVIDNRVYEYLTHTQHIFVCGGIPYVYMDGYYHMDLNGTILKTLIKECILEQFIRSTTIERIYKLFLQDRRLIKFQDELNRHTGRYINFQNGMYDVVSRKIYRHNPSIFSVNQIPWEYDPNADHGSGVEIENFLRKSIPDETDREMLLEYAGLCCSIEVHQQKMLVICGDGGTGKSTVINLIQDMVGKRNTSNVAMSKLADNFQAIRMMGKLLNSCADLEIDALDDVTMIKKLTGEDSISDSFKGKDVISFDNYAKLLFSTNELPLVRNEKTEGFYRRLLILTMNEKPEHRDAKLRDKLKAEMPYFIHIAMEALRRMYKRGSILESENSKELTKQLRADSDTIEAFIDECCMKTKDPDDKLERGIIYKKYFEFCDENGRQAHQKLGFFKAMRNKGYSEVKSHGTWYFKGIAIKEEGTDEDGFMVVPEGQTEIPFPE